MDVREVASRVADEARRHGLDFLERHEWRKDRLCLGQIMMPHGIADFIVTDREIKMNGGDIPDELIEVRMEHLARQAEEYT